MTARIEEIIRRIGQAASWVCLVLVAIVCASVILRYAFGISSLAFDELQWHIYSASFLLGFSYATVERTHVRNDILFNKFSPIWQKRIDFFSHLFLVVPFALIVIYHSWDFVLWSWKQNEGSIDPGGLSDRWIIKSFLLIGFFLFATACLTRSIDLFREIRALKRERA
ncbi:MAG: TRAP transporter small permease subunit [Pseudomonadota bacterium]